MTSILGRLALLVLPRPRLWLPALGAAWAFRPRDWYRRPPFLPLPADTYMRWRMETAYGDADASPSPEELGRYLRWAARMRRLM